MLSNCEKVTRTFHSQVSEVNGTNSTKGPIELSEFGLYCMNIFHDQLDNVYRFMGIPSDKEFPGCF